MSNLRIYVLGSPRVEIDESALDVDTRKATALLIYLALSDRPIDRSRLVDMFWPTYPAQRARANFRRALSVLRSALASQWLQVTGSVIDLDRDADLWVDMVTFRDILSILSQSDVDSPTRVEMLIRAAELYRDDFMQGFVFKNCPSFDEWQFFLREELRHEFAATLMQLVDLLVIEHNFTDAIKYAQRWVALDSSDETAHQALIRLYANSGQRSAALRQYRICAQMLSAELDVEPSAETQRLYDWVKSRRQSGSTNREPVKGTAAPNAVMELDHRDLTDELRTVTVLIMGLVRNDGSLGQSGPDRLHEVVKEAQAIVAGYGGHLEQTATGFLMATFGVEWSHEDDPLRAIFAALELHTMAGRRNLAMGAGIGTDLVYRTGQSSPSLGPIEISGSVIDLATRLQLEAAAGQTMATDSTYRQTRHALTFAPTPTMFKFRQRVATAHLVVGRRDPIVPTSGLSGLNAAMIGRDRELAAIQSALAQLLHGEGQIIFVSGDAGVGKSRLITEVRQKVFDSVPTSDPRNPISLTAEVQHGILWLEGRCLELSKSSSYQPIVDMLHTLVGWQDDDSANERAKRLVAFLHRLSQSGGLSDDQVDEIAPLLGHLLSLHFANRWDEALRAAAPEQIHHRVFAVLCLLFETLSRWTPVVVVFEDLHWSDGLSLDLIIHLMELVHRNALLMLCTYRNDRQQRCSQLGAIAAHKCPDRYQELRLQELTPGQSHQLINAYDIHGLDVPTKQRIVDRAQGNPLFLEEILRSLVEAGALIRDKSGWHAQAGLQTTHLPRRLQDITQGRVDQLEPKLRRLVRRASVIGRIFSKRVLARVIPGDFNLERGLALLESYSLIVQERALPDVEYAFRHVLVQEAIYASIPIWRRTELHGEVAKAIEALNEIDTDEHCEQLAFHYALSANDERAVHYLLMAGYLARSAYLNDEAVRYYLRAQERLDEAMSHNSDLVGEATWTRVARIQVQIGLGQVYHVVGKDQRAARHFRRALAMQQEIDTPLSESIRLLCWLGDVLLWQGKLEEVIDIGTQGVELLANDTQSIEAALMYQTVAMAAKIRGNYSRFWTYTEMTARFVRDLPYVEELMAAYVQIGEMHHDRGDASEAFRWAEETDIVAKKHSDLRLTAGVSYNRGCLHADMGRYECAIDHVRQAIETYARAGDENQKRVSVFVLAYVLLSDGQIDAAQQELATLDPIDRPERSALGMTIPHSGKAAVFLSKGSTDIAIGESMRSVELVDRLDLPLRDACARIMLARAVLASGDIEQAYRQFRRALTRCEPMQLLTAPLNTLGWPFRPVRPLLVAALAGLEETSDDHTDFQRFSRAYRAENPEVNGASFRQWYLTKRNLESSRFDDRVVAIPLDDTLPVDAIWQDPQGDCSYNVCDGLDIHAANGRDLWWMNRSAPRVLWPCGEDVALQSRVVRVDTETPALGGLLFWVDEHNYLCLEHGMNGSTDLLVSACMDGQSLIVGRGRLPGRHLWLRLERNGHQINSCCSPNGIEWQEVGQMFFPVQTPSWIGIYAIGNIDRTVYPGAFRQGSAIRFEKLSMRTPYGPDNPSA